MSNVLMLNCWIRSVDPGSGFQIKISKTETIYDPQKAIKNENPAVFHDADACTLTLHKPKHPVSVPYEENLTRFILSKHAEPLVWVCELSEVFPEPPPKRDIHVIVDAPSTILCYLRGANLNHPFPLSIQPGEGTERFILRIKDAQPDMRNVANQYIRLYRIPEDDNKLRESLRETGTGKPLQGTRLAPNFLGLPVLEPLRIVIEVPSDSPTLVRQHNLQEPISHSGGLERFKDVFLKVKNWGRFERSDIQRNRIEQARNIPDFVAVFERKLDRKPRLPKDLHAMNTSYIPESFFERSEGSTTKGGSQEGVREADLPEVTLTTFYLAYPKWQDHWRWDAPRTYPYNAEVMGSMLFHPFLAASKTVVALKDENWPITLVAKREEGLRRYCPKSEFLILKSNLPQLLVEVNSTARNPWPLDLIRMLTTGAFIVRFANKFVSTFEKKNFVLCAIFIRGNGNVTRYTLFQNQTGEEVYYNTFELSLNDPDDRAKLARYLYNLLHMQSDQDQDSIAKSAVLELNDRIKEKTN